MRNLIGIRALVVSSILVLGAAAAAAELARAPAQEPASASSAVFRVSGRVVGLYPGRAKTMKVRIRNPHPFAIRIKKLRIRVSEGGPGCRAGTIRIGKARVTRPVPARRRLRVRVPVKMRPAAPDACMGARYPLRFAGTAVRA
jgi:hypothetical protein